MGFALRMSPSSRRRRQPRQTRRDAPKAPPRSRKEEGFRKGRPASPFIPHGGINPSGSVSMGFALRMSPSSRRRRHPRQTRRDAPKAPPRSRKEEGFRKGRPASPCITQGGI